MALTRVAPAGIGSTPGTGYVIGDSFLHATGLNATNAYYTGIVTAQTFRVIGDFQVDGTTTTLDTVLTEVDKLEVGANNNTVGVAITQTGSGDILNLYDGSTEVFSVTDGGRVLIGTQTEGDSSADNLTIADSGNSGITIRSGTSNQGSIFFSDATSGSGEYDGFIQYSQNDRWLKFGTATSTRLTITSAGSVGINETSPVRKLHAKADGVPVARFERDTNDGEIIEVRDFNNNQIGGFGSDTGDLTLSATNSNNLRIETGGSERLRIASDGTVIVGTDTTVNPILRILGNSAHNSFIQFADGDSNNVGQANGYKLFTQAMH